MPDTDLGTTATTSVLTVNGAAGSSTIDTNGDQDWWRVSLTAGTAYTFRLNSASTGGVGDAYLRLLNSSGTQITADDDSGGNLNSLITYTPTATGTYYLSAEGLAGYYTGAYTISATGVGATGTDIPGTTVTTSVLTVNGAAGSSTIDTNGDTDWWRVSLTAGTAYTFRLNSASTGGVGDAYLRLLNSSGTQITADDDSGGSLNSLITYTPTATGTYYLSAEGCGGSNTGAYTISAATDGSSQPVLSIAASSADKSEGNSGSTAFTFTVTRAGTTTAASSASYAVTGGTASATDFTGGTLPSGTVSFAAGETSKTITINVAGDSTVESAETFNVVLSTPVGATLGTATATGTIQNDDSIGTDILGTTSTTSVLTVNGAAGSSTIGIAGDQDWWRVSLTAGTAYTFRLNSAATSGLGDPYLRLLNSSGTHISANDDGGGSYNSLITYTPTSTGTYYLSAEGYGGYRIGAYTISAATDGSSQPVLSIAASSADKSEGNSGSTAFTFTVTRAGTTTAASSASYAVTGGTASATDFTGGTLPSGTVSFAAGETSKTITINVAGDTTIESDETFTVRLSNPSGATLGTATATGIIRNDDVDIPGNTSTTSVLTVNGSAVPSTIDVTRDQDWWRVSLTAGTPYTFSLNTNHTGNGLTAPYLRLLNSSGTQITYNDDGFRNYTYSQITYTPTSTGTYYLSAEGHGGAYTGDYTISAAGGTNGGTNVNLIQGIWDGASNGLYSDFISVEGSAFESNQITAAVVDAQVDTTIRGVLSRSGLERITEVTIGIEVEGEITIGLAGIASRDLAGIATGYNLSYDFVDHEYTLSRDYSLSVLDVGVTFENYISFDTISHVPDTVTIGISAAGEYTDELSTALGQLFRVGGSFGQATSLTFSAEVVLDTEDFVANYAHQDNGDGNITRSEFALALADLLVPGFGDTWWQDIYTSILPSAASVLVDIATDRTDTFVGALINAPVVDLSVNFGTDLHAGAFVGLGGELPIVPLVNVGASISVGIAVSAGTELELWSDSRSGWSFNGGALAQA